MESIKLKLNNENGASLIIVLFVLIIASILTAAMIGTASNNLTQSSGEQESQSAFYIAEAGAVKEMHAIRQVIAGVPQTITSPQNFYSYIEPLIVGSRETKSFKLNKGEQPIAKVKVEKLDNMVPRKFKITSTGKIGTKSRVVVSTFTIDFKQGSSFQIPADLSLYTEQKIELLQGAQIKGSVATNLTGASSIILNGGAGISKQIKVPAGSEGVALSAPTDLRNLHQAKVTNFTAPFPHTLPVFPVFPTYASMRDLEIGEGNNKFKVIDNGNLNITKWQAQNYILNLDSNVYFKQLNVQENNTLTINLGSHDREIVVDELNLKNGTIHLSGTGKLTIFVKQNMDLGSGGGGEFNLNGAKEKLNIYLKGTSAGAVRKTISVGSSSKINGSLYAENANLVFNQGGGFLGHIVTGGDSVVLSGGARVGESLLLAPRANVKFLEGGKMAGSVISKSFYGEGGAELSYAPINLENILILKGMAGAEKSIELKQEPFRES